MDFDVLIWMRFAHMRQKVEPEISAFGWKLLEIYCEEGEEIALITAMVISEQAKCLIPLGFLD